MNGTKPLASKKMVHRVPWFSFVIPSLVLLLLGSPIAAQQDPQTAPKPSKCPYMEGRNAGSKDLAGTLGLTEEQSKRIEAIRKEFLEETAALKEDIQKKKAALDSMFRDPEVSDDKILAAQKDVAALKTEKMEKATAFRLKARSVLTPDQIRKIPSGCGLGIQGNCGQGQGILCPLGKKPCGKGGPPAGHAL
jgi:Spy/CpxP family protein refolding chaperone